MSRTCLTLCCSLKPRTSSTSSSSITLPSTTTPEHALQSGQQDLLQGHPAHHEHLQALPVDKQRHQESLWRENLQSAGNPRTTTPTGSATSLPWRNQDCKTRFFQVVAQTTQKNQRDFEKVPTLFEGSLLGREAEGRASHMSCSTTDGSVKNRIDGVGWNATCLTYCSAFQSEYKATHRRNILLEWRVIEKGFSQQQTFCVLDSSTLRQCSFFLCAAMRPMKRRVTFERQQSVHALRAKSRVSQNPAPNKEK